MLSNLTSNLNHEILLLLEGEDLVNCMVLNKKSYKQFNEIFWMRRCIRQFGPYVSFDLMKENLSSTWKEYYKLFCKIISMKGIRYAGCYKRMDMLTYFMNKKTYFPTSVIHKCMTYAYEDGNGLKTNSKGERYSIDVYPCGNKRLTEKHLDFVYLCKTRDDCDLYDDVEGKFDEIMIYCTPG